jgi:hypothetical protein
MTGYFGIPGEILLAKYSPDGVLLWMNRFAGTGTGNAVAIDGNDEIVIIGKYSGTVDFGGGPLSAATGWEDVFVAKYSADGDHLWSQGFGGEYNDSGLGIAVDSLDDVIITGVFRGTIDFGSEPWTTITSWTDIFMAKLDGGNGMHLWSTQFGGKGQDVSNGIATDDSGNIVLVGSFDGSYGYTVDFGGGAITSSGGVDTFVAKFSSNGTHLWSKGFGGSKSDTAKSVAVNDSGDLSIIGYFYDTADFGGGALTAEGYYSDIFLLNLGP